VVVERIRDEERHDLLGELEGAVVVGAVRDRHGQPVRLAVRPHGVVRGSLGGVVRRPGAIGSLLGEDLVAVERKLAVDLARGDVVEASHAREPRRVEERLRAEDVRTEEPAGVDDGEAVVRLGREVDDRVDRLVPEQPLDEVGVPDVTVDEVDPVLDVLEIPPFARVREEVEHDDAVVGMSREPVAHEVGADEARATRYEDPHPAEG
jgi:hypothetical protein